MRLQPASSRSWQWLSGPIEGSVKQSNANATGASAAGIPAFIVACTLALGIDGTGWPRPSDREYRGQGTRSAAACCERQD